MGGIRLLLALSVVAAHCGAIFGLRFVGGDIAIQAFFIISGFYMSLILNEKYTGPNNSYRLFISNRFFRLYPVYWVVLLLTVAACAASFLATNGQSAPKFTHYIHAEPNLLSFTYLVLTNIVILGQDLVMFMGIHPENGQLFFTGHFMESHPPLFLFLFIPQAWTLALECMFYLMAPFIVRKKTGFVACLLLLSLVCRLIMYNYEGLNKDPWNFRFFPTELMFFLAGYFSYRLYIKLKAINIALWLNLAILCVMYFFTAVYSFLPATPLTHFPFTGMAWLYFLCTMLSVPFLFKFSKDNRYDRMAGELSYPVYISHFLISMLYHSMPAVPVAPGVGVAFATILFSWLLYKLIAMPIERYRQSRLKKQIMQA